jgi:subtilisin family serine protease
VAAAIREKAPEASLIAVKVFDRTLAASIGTLVRAMDWAVDHGCDVVNLSLGTARAAHADRLRPVIERALRAGAVIVAAHQDGRQPLLPGSLPGVIGVAVDWDCPRDEIRVVTIASGQLVCRASGYPRSIPGVPPVRNLMGVSFAVANTSGIVARLLAVMPGKAARDRAAQVARMLIDNTRVPA